MSTTTENILVQDSRRRMMMEWKTKYAWKAEEMYKSASTIWPWQAESPIYGHVQSGYPTATNVNEWIDTDDGKELKAYQTALRFPREHHAHAIRVRTGSAQCSACPLIINGNEATVTPSYVKVPANSNLYFGDGFMILNGNKVTTQKISISELTSHSLASNYKIVINLSTSVSNIDDFLANPYDLVGVRLWHYWRCRSIEYLIK